MKNKAIIISIMLIMAACSNADKPSPNDVTPEENETQELSPSPTISSDPPNPPQLQVVGNKIVNEEGEIIVLRGIGTQQIINLATTSYDIPWNEELFRTIHEWGATVVRVLVAPVRFFEDEEEGLKILDQAIEWASKYDMYVIINFNTQAFPPTGFLASSNSVEMASDVDTLRFWQTVSERYSGNNVIAFYEIVNEPASHPWDGRTYLEDWLILKDFSELVIDLIRTNDPETIVIVGGLKWASDLSYVLNAPIQRSNVAYAMHLYPNTSDDWDQAFGEVAERHPVILSDTTFGIDVVGDYSYLNESNYTGDQPFRFALIDYIEERGLSWIAVVFSTLWDPGLLQNKLYEPSEVGKFFRDQLLSHEWKMTTGELISEDQGIFTGAVGQWESIDPTDGSMRIIVIDPIADHQYAVHYLDKTVPLCGVNEVGDSLTGAVGEGEGKAFYQKLDVGPLYLDCLGSDWTGGLYFDTFLYDSELDILTDILGTVWSRSEIRLTNLTSDDFNGAVGEWKSIDKSDGSNQTLSIGLSNLDNFTITYVDEKASFCGLDNNGSPLFAAVGNGIGKADITQLQISLDFVCIDDPSGTTEQYLINFEYDKLHDEITDTFSNVWIRVD